MMDPFLAFGLMVVGSLCLCAAGLYVIGRVFYDE
jgi:hypothetical protein